MTARDVSIEGSWALIERPYSRPEFILTRTKMATFFEE